MRRSVALLTVTALSAAPAALAQSAACPLPYAVFETSVPHTDLESCPASMQIENGYCRLVVNMELAHVYVFADTDDCLIATRIYDPEEYTLTIQ